MDEDRLQLIDAARAVCGELKLRKDFSAGGVGAAVRTADGNVYTGVCIDLGCGLGFCAEVAAIAEMLKNRETHIAAVVAVSGRRIMPPCGRCRETMAQIDARNFNCRVIVDEDRDVPLQELLPAHWVDDGLGTRQGSECAAGPAVPSGPRDVIETAESHTATRAGRTPEGPDEPDRLEREIQAQRDFNAVQVIYRNGAPHTDARGKMMMRYEPERSFFQIGLWGAPLPGAAHGREHDWAVLKDAGFNTVWPWPGPKEAALEAAKRLDLHLILMDPLGDDEMATLGRDERVLGNVWKDEPTGSLGTVDMDKLFTEFQDYKKKANSVAPELLVFVNEAHWIMSPAKSWWVRWNTAGDVSCHDNYPMLVFRHQVRSIGADPFGIPQSVSLATAVNNELKPVWLIVGPFTHPKPPGPFPNRFPSPVQLRAQIYAGLIHGATGIIYVTWDTFVCRDFGVIGMSPDPQVTYVSAAGETDSPRATPATPMELVQSKALWEAAVRINGELEQLTPALLSPSAGRDVEYRVRIVGRAVTDMPIRCLLKSHPDGGYVLLTVNLDDAVLNVTHTFPQGIERLEPLFENRHMHEFNPQTDSFAQTYDPFETHVFRVYLK